MEVHLSFPTTLETDESFDDEGEYIETGVITSKFYACRLQTPGELRELIQFSDGGRYHVINVEWDTS